MSIWDESCITYAVSVRTPDSILRLTGRDAWALQHLMQAGEKGVTPIQRPAPRWSAYVHNLRKQGFDIETVYEEHGGRYGGQHGRYILHTPCERIGGMSYVDA